VTDLPDARAGRAVVPLPPSLEARARSYLSGAASPARPRDAATVALVRDTDAGPEVYLLRRVTSMAFAAGMHVFPGGGVDERDDDPTLGWVGPAAPWWAERLSCPVGLARALVCAAVRETFEESGVLLAGESAQTVVDDTSGDDWEADRQALIERRVPLRDVLHGRGLSLRADLLRPWAHWITPEFEERRYDTKFFVAAVPRGQRTRHVSGEADRVAWLRPADALARHREGDLAMLPPTVAVLASLAEHPDVASVLDHAPRIVPMLPRPVLTDGDRLGLVVEERVDLRGTAR
jgi:8-oxo-dGTP pyrophosphatase MutT (NUDIX family)